MKKLNLILKLKLAMRSE